MGQKANPIGLRIGVIKTWSSIWFAGDKDYSTKLHQDLEIKQLVKKTLANAGISKVVIKRSANKKIIVEIYAARPGMVIGRGGADIEKLKKKIEGIAACETAINIQEVRKPEVDAKLVADAVAQQLEKRIAFRKASKRAVQSAMRMGAKGIRINVSGRLGGAEIARMEWYREGRVPLHTLRADIDYATSEAHTTYGKIGVKVWIYKGDVGVEAPKVEKDVKVAN